MDHFFDLPSHRLAYRLKESPGKPHVLFLHGLGANLSQFDGEFTSLAKDYSVASLSLRGQGKSTRPPGDKPEDMKIASLASDVIHWLNAHNWKQPRVIACSMGGVIALEILHQQSQLLNRLITFGTAPKLNISPNLVKIGAWVSDVFLPGLFPNWMAKMLPKTTTDKPEAQQRFAADLKIAYSQRTTIYQLRCELANYDYTQALKTSTIPVLLLQGEKDSGINREIDKIWPLIQENPLVKREILSDAGHIANYDQPQAFYNSVIQFLRSERHD